MKTQYFKSTLTGIVWRFSDAGNSVFADGIGWIPTAMELGGMNSFAVEMTAEEVQP